MENQTSPAVAPQAASSGPRLSPTFFGISYHKVSPRNQVAIPAHMMKVLRERPEGQLFLVRWRSEPFLRLLTQRHMDCLVEKLRTEAGLTEAQSAEAEELLCSNAQPVDPDSQGRVVPQADWVAALGLEPEVAIVGRYHYIEIWPAAQYRARQAQAASNIGSVADKLRRVLSRS